MALQRVTAGKLMDPTRLSDALQRDPEGIFRARDSAQVSYPRDGHDNCLMVEDASFWFRHRNDCIAQLIRNHPFSGTLLDVGGGNGFVARRLQDEGYDVVLLEPGDPGARNARTKRGLDHVVCATIDSAAFHDGAFGAIGMFDVIEHVQNDAAFLARASKLLEERGRVYMTVPCHDWLWSQADVDAGHFRRHTVRSMQDLLSPLFDIDYISYFFAPLVLPQYLFRALPYRFGIGRNRQVLSTEAAHGTARGPVTRLVSRVLAHEAARLEAGESIRWGASCLVAATLR